MEFTELEARDGVRFSFNVWPSSRIEASRAAAPFGCIWSPVKPVRDLLVLPYEPVLCKSCTAVLNPYAQIDFNSKSWVCPFCFKRTPFPPHYNQISETALPGELMQGTTTVEYDLPQQRTLIAPAVVFVVDTVNVKEEIAQLTASLINAITLIPENVRLGLITYGKDVFLWELGGSDVLKSHMIKGETPMTASSLQELLFTPAGGQGVSHARSQMLDALFLVSRENCEFQISAILEEIEAASWPTELGDREPRCTGAAIATASSLLELGPPTVGSRILVLTGGPCTVGPGTVASMKQTDKLRSHNDIAKGNAPFTSAAQAFYESIADRMVNAGQVCDLFGMALDQLGLLEMRSLTERTGGHLVNHEAFRGGTQGEIYTKSLMKLFEANQNGALNMCYNGSIEVRTAAEFKVCGAIGPITSKKEAHSCVSELEIGVAGTRAWKMTGLDENSSISLYFEITNAANNPIKGNRPMQLQLLCHYTTPEGKSRLRVTTVARRWATAQQTADVGASFDQETAAVLTARLVSWRAQHEHVFDVLRWLDRMLIRLCSKFGQYKKDDPTSFSLPSNVSIFPQFMFHLRRSQFLQVFNSSPDETAYFRYHLIKQNLSDCLVMIQPTLVAYTLSAAPAPVLLDNSSILPDRVLLLDAFFWVTVWTGETIAAWRNQGYHEQPGYENVKQLLEEPIGDVQNLTYGRMPVSRVIETDQHKSQSRFLLAKLNPSITHMSGGDQSGYGQASNQEVVFTDDVSLQVFVQHLGKLAVQGT